MGAPFLPYIALSGPNRLPVKGGRLLRFFQKFLRENRGAVTVDWVVMTALVMGMIFMANLLAAYLAHRLAKHSPLRALAPEWASGDAGAKFPMGLPLASSLMIYLAIASL